MSWDIFDEIQKMQEEMDRMFNDFFRRPYYQSQGPGKSLQESGERAAPRLREAFTDVQETDSEVIITVELPGMSKEDIQLNITSDRLEIRAETKEEQTETKGDYRLSGKRYAGFYRSIPFPVPVKAEKAKATYKNGVLEVILPKKEVTESRNIKID
ncbi:MAG: Hsp20/alpha crystallin family protein [Theionarchaea archaeon]|nr:Hsp20/alpha crystallin family protein [Theionarchaea archaeon]MBU7000569.1 Hsp20/alpha crystallin family protein [Theionarchaea archaeon]MBU7020471.1 Hsp20/alpha crystallin family protein [Theionarchaea archaeon]MBU7035669.1 Hsp20/alpha crystallin family protein [Theionarchaea archaeon]MBU7041765.1 Hsp20/alpha crystallin family protein [Theionarchaea archaeon]